MCARRDGLQQHQRSVPHSSQWGLPHPAPRGQGAFQGMLTSLVTVRSLQKHFVANPVIMFVSPEPRSTVRCCMFVSPEPRSTVRCCPTEAGRCFSSVLGETFPSTGNGPNTNMVLAIYDVRHGMYQRIHTARFSSGLICSVQLCSQGFEDQLDLHTMIYSYDDHIRFVCFTCHMVATMFPRWCHLHLTVISCLPRGPLAGPV